MFDPRRTAILLLGGDKSGQWEAWYREAIPLAEALYDAHLDELRERPGAAERIEQYKREHLRELSLGELRKARAMTQEQLARALDIRQSGVSRIEHETDLYLSTLRSYCEALGGRLELRAVFEDDEILIEAVEALEPEPV